MGNIFCWRPGQLQFRSGESSCKSNLQLGELRAREGLECHGAADEALVELGAEEDAEGEDVPGSGRLQAGDGNTHGYWWWQMAIGADRRGDGVGRTEWDGMEQHRGAVNMEEVELWAQALARVE